MPAEGIACDDFGFAVCGSGIEIVYAVRDGVVDHPVDRLLVEVAATAVGIRYGGQAHAAEAEKAQLAAQAVPTAGIHLGPFGCIRHGGETDPGGRLRAAAGSAGLHKRTCGSETDSYKEHVLDGLAARNLLAHLDVQFIDYANIKRIRDTELPVSRILLPIFRKD